MYFVRGLRYFSFILVFVAGGLLRLSAAQMPSLSDSAMLSCSSLPCVDVTVNGGQHLKMLIDTGNANSTLDQAVAKSLGLTLTPINGPDGKPYPGYSSALLKNVYIGKLAFGDVEILVANLQQDIQKGSFPVADGTLAYTAFHDRVLRMDYANHSIGISEIVKSGSACPAVCGVITTPTFGKSGPPIVVTSGFRVNGKELSMQIDTLYAGTMLIYPTSVEKLGFSEQVKVKSVKSREFPFTDGGVRMIEGRSSVESFKTIEIQKDGTLYFATPEVHTPDGMFDGTVGNELFLNHILVFDFHGNTFSMV